MSFFILPGAWVLLSSTEDWGLGQVQSVVGPKVTVNFEHAGKVVVNTEHATLRVLDDNELDAYVAERDGTSQN